MLGLESAEGAAFAVWESRATEVRAAVARAGVRIPAMRVPVGLHLRCDAKRGDSFRLPPTELAVGFGRVIPEGLPYGPCPSGQLDRFTPRSVGSPAPAAVRRTGLGGGRTARRCSPVGSSGLPGTLANS